MTLSEQSAALRRRLYDNRHWLPLLLYPAALLALLIARPFNIIPDSFVFTLLCAVISLSGVAVRVLTVGYLPRKSEEEVESGVHSTTLITQGMYSTVRHPIALGNLLAWYGIILYEMCIRDRRKTIRISVIRAANISRSVLLPRSYTTRSSTPATATSRCRSTTAPRQIRAKTPSRPDGNTKGRNRIRLKAAQKRRQEPQQRTGNAAKRIKTRQGTVTGNGPEPELKPGQKRVQVPER